MEERKKYSLAKPFFSKGAFLCIALLLVFGIVIPFQFAHAQVFSVLSGIGVGFVLSLINYLLQFLAATAAFFAAIAGSFMQWILHDFPLFYTKCQPKGCFLDIAWYLARDLANIWLAIAIIVIAVSTIVGKESYGMRKALIPLIVAALFVNFSRVLVGVFVDLSNIIMNVFVQAMPNFSDLSSVVGQSGFSFGNFSFSADVALDKIAQTTVSILFFLGLAFIFALYGIIFAVRYGALWFLTILSPIAFVAYIFPSTKKFFDQWMKQLIEWCIVGIPMLFFLWIAMTASQQFKTALSATAGAGASDAEKFFAIIIPKLFSLLLLYIAFAFGMKSNAMGTGAILKTGKAWAGKMQGAARSAALAPARWARTKAEQRLTGAAEKGLGAVAGMAGNRFVRYAQLGGLFRGTTALGSQKLEALKQKRLGDAQKKATSMPEAMRLRQIQSETDPDNLKALIETQHKADPDSVGKLMKGATPSAQRMRKRMEALVKDLSLRNLEKDILNYFPEYAHASRNRPSLDPIKDREILDRIRAGGLTADEGVIAKHVKDKNKDKAKLISSGSLANKAVMIGLDLNKNVDPLEDLATTNERMENIIQGYVAKHGGDTALAMEDIAEKFKRKNIKFAASLFAQPEFLKALLEKNPRILTSDFLEDVADQHGKPVLNELFKTAHEPTFDRSGRLNYDTHDKVFAERFLKNDKIKDLIEQDLIDQHNNETPWLEGMSPDQLNEFIRVQEKKDPGSIRKLIEGGRISHTKMADTVRNLSMSVREKDLEKDIVSSFPEYAYASNNRLAPDPRTDKDLFNLVRSGKLTMDEAIVAKNVKGRSKEELKRIDSGSLATKAVMFGVDYNKNGDALRDIATTQERMDRVVEGKIAKYDGSIDLAMRNIADQFSKSNIPYAASLLQRSEFLKALLQGRNADKLTVDFLEDIQKHLGKVALNDLFQASHAKSFDAFGRPSDDPHKQVFIDKFLKDPKIRRLIAPALIRQHDSEMPWPPSGGATMPPTGPTPPGRPGYIPSPPPVPAPTASFPPTAPPRPRAPTPPGAAGPLGPLPPIPPPTTPSATPVGRNPSPATPMSSGAGVPTPGSIPSPTFVPRQSPRGGTPSPTPPPAPAVPSSGATSPSSAGSTTIPPTTQQAAPSFSAASRQGPPPPRVTPPPIKIQDVQPNPPASAPPNEQPEAPESQTTHGEPYSSSNPLGYWKSLTVSLPDKLQRLTQNLSPEEQEIWRAAIPVQKAFSKEFYKGKRPMKSNEFISTYNNLPPDVQEAMGSIETANVIHSTAKAEGVLSHISLLAEITGDVMLGKLPIDFFTNTVQAELYIDHTKAQRITDTIETGVFGPIEKELQKSVKFSAP